MNDLDVLREMRASVPEPSSAAMAVGRARLTTSIQAHPEPAPARPSRRPGVARPATATGALAALAVTATVIAVSVSSTGRPGTRSHHPAASGPSVKAELTAKVLRQAAATTARLRVAEPSPRQWFYSKTVDYEFGNSPTTTVDEEWGTFNGKLTAYTAGGQLIVHANPGDITGRGATALDRFDSTATPRTAYLALASLPSDPAALLPVIETHVAKLNPSQVLSPIEQYAPKSSRQVDFSYLVELMWNAADGEPPTAQANIYLAMARLPGVTVQRGVIDAAGRATIAVSDNGGIDQLLLDPRTYAVIGIREVSDGTSPGHLAAKTVSGKASPWPPRGAVLESLAIAELKPVAGPGRR